MTHSSQLTHALGAMRTERATRGRSEQASMKFLIFADNSGDYRWTLVAAGGERLAQSARFASSEEATRAARIARAGAASAPIEDHAADGGTTNLSARRKIAIERDGVVTHRSRSSKQARRDQHE